MQFLQVHAMRLRQCNCKLHHLPLQYCNAGISPFVPVMYIYAVSLCVQDPLVLRKKAADFRNGYKNWRQKKAKGECYTL
jgi:hypothetical protein